MLRKQLSERKLNMLTSISKVKSKHTGGFGTRVWLDGAYTEDLYLCLLQSFIFPHPQTQKCLKQNWDLLCAECYATLNHE